MFLTPTKRARRFCRTSAVELETGKMYAILGPSGSGKTTLLSLLGGLDVPTQGSVLFDGEDITAKGLEHHRRNHISLIFQSYNLIDYMTPLRMCGSPPSWMPPPFWNGWGLQKMKHSGMC